MTAKRESNRKQDEEKSAKRPKLKKETLKDLEAKEKDEPVRGGAAFRSMGCQCTYTTCK